MAIPVRLDIFDEAATSGPGPGYPVRSDPADVPAVTDVPGGRLI